MSKKLLLSALIVLMSICSFAQNHMYIYWKDGAISECPAKHWCCWVKFYGDTRDTVTIKDEYDYAHKKYIKADEPETWAPEGEILEIHDFSGSWAGYWRCRDAYTRLFEAIVAAGHAEDCRWYIQHWNGANGHNNIYLPWKKIKWIDVTEDPD